MNLEEYLDGVLRRKFKWGSADCCCFAFDWVRARRDVDPMEPWRGKYSDQASAIRQYAKSGGLDAVIAKRMDDLGFVRTDDPETGDVGIIRAPTGMRNGAPVMGPVAAIRCGPRWLAMHLDGLVGYDFEQLAAWKI